MKHIPMLFLVSALAVSLMVPSLAEEQSVEDKAEAPVQRQTQQADFPGAQNGRDSMQTQGTDGVPSFGKGMQGQQPGFGGTQRDSGAQPPAFGKGMQGQQPGANGNGTEDAQNSDNDQLPAFGRGMPGQVPEANGNDTEDAQNSDNAQLPTFGRGMQGQLPGSNGNGSEDTQSSGNDQLPTFGRGMQGQQPGANGNGTEDSQNSDNAQLPAFGGGMQGMRPGFGQGADNGEGTQAPGTANGQMRQGRPDIGDIPDLEAIRAQIEAMEDGEEKEALLSQLEAFESMVKALEEARTTAKPEVGRRDRSGFRGAASSFLEELKPRENATVQTETDE